MTLIAFKLMSAIEQHKHLSVTGYVGNNQIFEETVELAAYLFMLSAQQRVVSEYYGRVWKD